MRIAVLTSNQPRHVALVDALVEAGHDVFAIVEPKTFGQQESSLVMRNYWGYVRAAEREVFGGQLYMRVPVLTCKPGEASHLPALAMMDVLKADRVVTFGCSYLRGEFARALIRLGALNLHVGIAPEYRGSAPNFWALYDGNEHLVGAQVQRLSEKLDAGEVLAEERPYAAADPFFRGMLAVRLGIRALVSVLAVDPSTLTPLYLYDRPPIRYARYADFTEAVVKEYMDRLGR